MIDFFNRVGDIIDQIIGFFQNTFQSIQDGVATITTFWQKIGSFFVAFPVISSTVTALLALLLTWIILSIARDFV